MSCCCCPWVSFLSQGVAKLPFIDEERLLAEVSKVEDTLTKEEQWRNSVLADLLFISRSHPLAAFVFSFYDCYGHLEGRQRIQVMKKIPPAARYGFKV
jgi:5'-3' exoribonuclease 2